MRNKKKNIVKEILQFDILFLASTVVVYNFSEIESIFQVPF